MKSNEGNTDRLIRGIIGLGLFAVAWLYWGALGMAIGGVIVGVGVIMVVTAIVGWCPAYAIFGISTCKLKN